MKKIIALCLSLFMIISIVTPILADNTGTIINSDTSYDEEIPINSFYSAISNTDFVGNGVIYVIMHHHISDVGKIYTEDDFPELDIEGIEDYTSANLNDKKEDYGSNFRNILKITLTNKDDNSVVNAIQKLQERADEDIYWAEPAYPFDLGELTITSSIDTESLIFTLMDYWKSTIKYLDNTENNTVNYIKSNIPNLSERTPVKVAIVEGGGVNNHSDFNITVQGKDGELSNISIFEDEVDLRKEDEKSNEIKRGHATLCARFLAASSAIDNVQTISITSFILGANVRGDSASEDAETHLKKIVDNLNQRNIMIASMSFGAPYSYYNNIVTATSVLNNYKGLFITASGNDGLNVDGDIYNSQKPFPAAMTSNNIIVVGASNESDQMWVENGDESKGSNYGINTVDIFAPGEETISYLYDEDQDGVEEVCFDSGTSAATPIVAGVAALMKYVNPDLTNLQIKAILMNTSDRNDAFIGNCVSGGRLNAYEAVRIAHGLANNTLSEADMIKAEYLFISNIPTIENADGETVLDTANETFRIDKCVSARESVTLPQTFRGKNVTLINAYAFDVNTCTESATVPSTVQVSPRAFNQSDSLITVSFADGTTTIPQGAFAQCHNVKNVYIPDTVESLGGASLNDALIFTNQKSILESKFIYNFVCENGYSVGVVSGNTIIDYSAGSNDASRDITLPSNLNGIEITTIGGHAFDEADNIVSVEIPDTVETIGYRAFRNCNLLRTLVIPPSVTSISNSMNSTIVEGSTNAVIYCGNGSYTSNYAKNSDITCIEIHINTATQTASVIDIEEADGWGTEYYIPESFAGCKVVSIDYGAFYINMITTLDVTKIVVPKTVTSIGSSAFSSCSNLTDIYINSAETTLGSNCFYPYNKANLTIHCYDRSPAYTYALANGHRYQLM